MTMKITKITVYQIDLPLRKPYWLSGGRLKFETLDGTFVCLETDAGIKGWGESTPWGHTYLPAHGAGVRAGIETLAPHLIGHDPRALAHINRIMDTQLPGHPYAKSPLDVACWDILGQSAKMPLWMIMGGTQAEAIYVNSSISTGTTDEMITLIEQARAQGYRTHSAKLGGQDARADIERIEGITAALLPHEQVTFDINRAWTPATALQVLGSTQSRAWIEQPCETLEQCAFVAQKVPHPILLDECLHNFDDHLRAWQLGAMTGLKIKPNRLGGLTKSVQIRDLALQLGWQMHIEDVGGSALADTAALHLASATPVEYRLDSWLAHAHLAVDPVPMQGVRNINGQALVPSDAGLGVVPDTAHLGQPCAIYGGI